VQHAGFSKNEAQSRLECTHTADKNELLFQHFGINYSNLPALHRRGTVLFKSKRVHDCDDGRKRTQILPAYCDIINDGFWETRAGLLDGILDDYSPVESER